MKFLPSRCLILRYEKKISAAALEAMAEADIEREMNTRLKKQTVLPSKKDSSSRRLITIRVVTGADIERLRVIREAQDQNLRNMQKEGGNKGKEKVSGASTPSGHPQPSGKHVRITSEFLEGWQETDESDSDGSGKIAWTLFPTSIEALEEIR